MWFSWVPLGQGLSKVSNQGRVSGGCSVLRDKWGSASVQAHSELLAGVRTLTSLALGQSSLPRGPFHRAV